MKISRISFAKNIPAFGTIGSPEHPPFSDANLIYGFNGSGKTTIGRMFASLGLGTLHPLLPEEAAFVFELDDGQKVGTESDADLLRDRVFVFNADFVDDNFKWADGTAQPIFYLGAEQAGLAAQLERLQRTLEADRAEEAALTKTLRLLEQAMATFKKDTARGIGEQTKQRVYNAVHFDNAIDRLRQNEIRPLTDAEIDRQKHLLSQAEALPKLKQIEIDEFVPMQLSDLVRDIRACLAQTAGRLPIAELNTHDAYQTTFPNQ